MSLLALGTFAFEAGTAPFRQLQRKRGWRHPANERVGARAAGQFAGPGDDIITLTGVVAPGFVGRLEALEQLADMADSGEAWPLVDGEGTVYGAFVITDLDEGKREFLGEGLPRICDFTLQLKRMDDDAGEDGAAGEPVR